jgi:glutamate-1-semialdehyde aminotransferase
VEDLMVPKKRDSANSQKYWQKAASLIMNKTHTYGRIAAQHIVPECPLFLKRGKGARVFDVDGNEYVDLTAGLGSIILGYSDSTVNQAIREQMQDGIFFGLTHSLEIEAAEKFCGIVPCAQMVRFFKTGAEAASAAVRVARSYTERSFIIKASYHGWHDWTIALSNRNVGIPAELSFHIGQAEYNSIDSFKELFYKNKGNVAAVIMEPVMFEKPAGNFLREVYDLCKENEAILIFDEILTGCRFAKGGAQEFFNIIPDLAVFSKAIANGMPLSVLAGSRTILEKAAKNVFISSTFGGELLSIACMNTIISLLEQGTIIESLWEKGRRIKEFFNSAFAQQGISDILEVEGYAPRLRFSCRIKDKHISSAVIGQLIISARSKGIVTNVNMFPMVSHSEADFLLLEKAASETAAELGRLFDTGNHFPRGYKYLNKFF